MNKIHIISLLFVLSNSVILTMEERKMEMFQSQEIAKQARQRYNANQTPENWDNWVHLHRRAYNEAIPFLVAAEKQQADNEKGAIKALQILRHNSRYNTEQERELNNILFDARRKRAEFKIMLRDYANAADKHRLVTQTDNWHPWLPEEEGDPETEDPFAGMFEDCELRVIGRASPPPQPSRANQETRTSLQQSQSSALQPLSRQANQSRPSQTLDDLLRELENPRTSHETSPPPQPSLIKCPICLDEKPAHEFAALNCSHVFCTSPCFWQLKGKPCPICRQ